jgi:hypothetical protein
MSRREATEEELKELGFKRSPKEKDLWLCKYPLRRSYFESKEGIIDVYKSNDLGSIANAFFQAGVDTGRLQMSDEIRKILDTDSQSKLE